MTYKTKCPIHIEDMVEENRHISPLEPNKCVLSEEDITILAYHELSINRQNNK